MELSPEQKYNALERDYFELKAQMKKLVAQNSNLMEKIADLITINDQYKLSNQLFIEENEELKSDTINKVAAIEKDFTKLNLTMEQFKSKSLEFDRISSLVEQCRVLVNSAESDIITAKQTAQDQKYRLDNVNRLTNQRLAIILYLIREYTDKNGDQYLRNRSDVKELMNYLSSTFVETDTYVESQLMQEVMNARYT